MGRAIGARTLPVSANQAQANTRLIGGPVRVCGWSFSDQALVQGLTVDQAAIAPAAHSTIASISLPNGRYTVSWTLEITGTPGAGDIDNVQLFIGAAQVATSVNLGAVGNYGQEEVQVQVTGGPLLLAWVNPGAATAGTTYKVEASIQPLTGSAATIFDGGLAVGFVSIFQGAAETRWFEGDGICVETQMSVQTTLGTVAGVIWYYLLSDLDPTGKSDAY